jgi:hypothetical protein
MVVGKLLELQEVLRQDGILISFSGRFSQGIIEELGQAIREHMQAEDQPKSEVHNVFAVFVEQTHNVRNYAAAKEGAASYERIANSGIVTIGKVNDEAYFICSGNLVENQDVPRLRERIDRLVSLDKNGLKQLYKELIRRDPEPGSLGAGVGLVEIARKASRPIQYTVLPLDEQFSFFTLNVTV